jgi:hypothetical protein
MKLIGLQRTYRNLVTGAESPLLFEALAGLPRVTLARDFMRTLYGGRWYDDPFLEVRTLHPREVDTFPCESLGRTPTSSLDELIEVVCQTIVEVWDPTKTHVVFHSSGYDSRVISGCLRKLRNERGDEWLGQVLFLSERWEAALFRQIMRAQGWQPEQYATHDDMPLDEHYATSLDFATHWWQVNAPFPLPGRFWWFLVAWAQRRGLLPATELIQTFHGQAQRTWRYARRRDWAGWRAYRDSAYYDIMVVEPPGGTRGASILAATPILTALAGYTGPHDGDKLRVKIADKLSSETRGIPNPHLGQRGAPIAAHLLAQCERDFRGSVYARLTGTTWQAPAAATACREWALYGLASLCEHLHREGVELCTA